MKIADLKKALKGCNLCLLGRLSGVPTRTIRRIKNGEGGALASTVERIVPHISKATM